MRIHGLTSGIQDEDFILPLTFELEFELGPNDIIFPIRIYIYFDSSSNIFGGLNMFPSFLFTAEKEDLGLEDDAHKAFCISVSLLKTFYSRHIRISLMY